MDQFTISNLSDRKSAFEDAGAGDNRKVHIRIQQRNGRKSITTIEGIDSDLDFKKILKYMKRNFKCNGKAINDKRLGEIIQLQGDQRENARNFMLDMEIVAKRELIVIHGF
eukprot:g6148.t1